MTGLGSIGRRHVVFGADLERLWLTRDSEDLKREFAVWGRHNGDLAPRMDIAQSLLLAEIPSDP
jgi:hypothetical protein